MPSEKYKFAAYCLRKEIHKKTVNERNIMGLSQKFTKSH